MFSQVSVFPSVTEGLPVRGSARGVCLGGGFCIWRGVGQTPRILWDTVNEQTVCIILECILVLYFI